MTIADRLRRVISAGDVAARLGGDEFAVLCPAVLAEDVVAIAQRIIDAIEAPIPVDGGTTIVGVSIGIAFDDDDGEGDANAKASMPCSVEPMARSTRPSGTASAGSSSPPVEASPSHPGAAVRRR